MVQNTGSGHTPLSEVQTINVAAGLFEPRLAFNVGFGTAETVLPGTLLDSYTVTLQTPDRLATAVYLTVDAGGLSLAPGTPGGTSVDPSEVSLLAVPYPDLQPALPALQAYLVSLAIPSQFRGTPVHVHFDLFDNQDAQPSQGWFSQVRVESVAEPRPLGLLLLGGAFWGLARRGGTRRQFQPTGPKKHLPVRPRPSSSSSTSIRGLLPCLLAALWCLALPTTGQAQPRILTLDGVRVAFEDISAEAEAHFRSMRFNRALNQWNVEVTVSNTTPTPITGPLLLLIESAGGVGSVLQPDGIDQGQPYFDLSTDWSEGDLPSLGSSRARTLSLGYLEGGSPRLVTRVLRRLPTGSYALGLTRSLDGIGHPLPGVTVRETGPSGAATLLTDANLGVVTLGRDPGQHVWKFSADGCLPVWRHQNLAPASVALIPNPRLVPRNRNPVSVTPGGGGVVRNALDTISITFGGASFAEATAVTLTPLTAQTLPAWLPLGWSPLQAFWVEWEGQLNGAAPLRLWPWGRIEFAENAVLAKWNLNATRWEVAQAVSGNRHGPVIFNLSESGAYALVVADTGLFTPPPPGVGQPLPPSLQAIPDLASLTALGTVTPPASPASRNPELVTATASVSVRHAAPLPSGLLLRCEVSDAYELNSGARLTPPRYEAFVAAYQRPGDDDPATLEAAFPMRSLLLLVEELTRAAVTAEVLTPGSFEGGVFDMNGGRVRNGSIRLLANAGDLARPQAVELRSLDPNDLPGLVLSPQEIVAAFELQTEAMPAGKAFVLRLPDQNANGFFVLARVLARDGLYGLEPVERFTSDASGRLASAEPDSGDDSGDRFAGVTGAGQFVLARLPAAQGLVHGIARDAQGRAQADVPVRVEGQPWLTFSAADGQYRLLAPQGEATIAVLDPSGGRSSLSSLVIADPANAVGLDVSTAPAGPRVLKMTPSDGATNVTRVTQIAVEFSKPVNPATLLAGGVRLLDPDDKPVAGALSLNLAHTMATFLSTDELAPNVTYRIEVSTQVTDLSGLVLEGLNTAQFTTQPAPLDRAGAALTSYEPVHGQAALVGTPGTAEAHSPVILVNETTGRTATILSRADGSFSHAIPAEVDDTLSAVMVNQNGTRNTVAVSRQVYADGSVGLFKGGGTLEVTNENGVAQFTIEPGAIDQKTVFKVEAVSLTDTRALLGNVEPTNGMVLGGFKLASRRGSPLRRAMEVNFPINPALLPGDLDPAQAAFGLAAARVIDGQQVFVLVDSMEYEAGRLVTHSPPFRGVPDVETDQLLLPMLVSRQPAMVVFGRVYSARVDAAHREISGTDKDLPGAVIRAATGVGAGVADSLLAGAVCAVSGTNGHYSLLAVKPTLSATHARFPRLRAEQSVPQNSTNLHEVNLRFSIPDSAKDIPPELSVTHLPRRQEPGQIITNTVVARGDNTDATIFKPEIRSVVPLTPGEDVTAGEIAIAADGQPEPLDPQIPFAFTQRFTITSPKAAIVDLLFSATDGNGNKTVLPHAVQFSGPDPVLPPDPIPGSDFLDRTGPRVERSVPETPGGTLMAASPITLKFDEPIRTNILQRPAALTIAPPCHEPLLSLSEDQTVLTLRYLDLRPDTAYRLTLGASFVEDLYGNPMDQDPLKPGDDDFVLRFTAGTLPSGPLTDPSAPSEDEGMGAVANGHYAYVLERSEFATGRLLVYDLRTPHAAPVATVGLTVVPRDLVLIPQYSFHYAPTNIYLDRVKRKHVTTNDFHEVYTKDLLVVVGGIAGRASSFRVYDVSDPTQPFLLSGTLLSAGDSLVSGVRWRAPRLGLLEVGSRDRVTQIDLQANLIGSLLFESPTNFLTLGMGQLGLDDNVDGDYTDPGDRVPLPPGSLSEIIGKQGSLGIADTTQQIRDVALEEQGAFVGAVVLKGFRIDDDGKPDTNRVVEAGYRTMQDRTTPVLLEDGFFPITNGTPRRIFTMFKHLIRAGTNTAYYDLALISVNSPPNEGTNHVLVLNLTNRLAPSLLLDIPIPKSPGSSNLFSMAQRTDGTLLVAGETNAFILDPDRFGAAMLDSNKVGHTIVGMIPGTGGDALTFSSSASGVVVSGRVPKRPAYVETPPLIEIVTFPDVDPFVPKEWLDTLTPDTVASNVLKRLDGREQAAALRLARFRKEEGYCLSTLADITSSGARSVHYYVLVRTMGVDPARDYIDLALESLNWAGAPLKKRGFLFPPVHAFSQGTLEPSKLDQVPDPAEDAPVRACRAWRLSDDPESPLFDVFLSRPFALVGESLSREELDELDKKLSRDVLWSGHYLRVSIDPAEGDTHPALEPFAGRVEDGRYHPGVFLTLPSLPGEFLQSPNPMPVRGGATVGLAGGFVGAHNSELIVDTVDLNIPGRRMPVSFGRHYSGQALHHGPFGRGWDFTFNERLVELSPDLIVPGFTNPVVVRAQLNDSEYATNRDLVFHNGSGRAMVYKWSGTNPPPEVAEDKLAVQLGWALANRKPPTNVSDYYLPPPGLFSPLVKFRDGRFASLDPDGTQHWFNQAGRLIKIYDRWETNSIELHYGNEGDLISIRSDGGTPRNRLRLDIGYFRNPNSGPYAHADVITNQPSLAGRICRLLDHTGREVAYVYKNGDLAERHGIEVKTRSSPNGLGFLGRHITRYTYSDASDPDRTRKSLTGIRGPNREQDIGGVDKTLEVQEFVPGGRDMVKRLYVGEKMLVTFGQAHPNTAKALSAASPGSTVVEGPPTATAHTSVAYEFDPFGRPAQTIVSDAGANPIVTGMLYDTNGLVTRITFPELNTLSHGYETNNPALRSRANLVSVSRDPGPRGGSPLVAGFNYHPLFNLPSGEQQDFRGKITFITLASDNRSILAVAKGGETNTTRYQEHGLLSARIDPVNAQTRFEYTPDGFLATNVLEDATGAGPPLVTRYAYTGRPGLRGMPSSIIDPTGVSTTLTCDELDRVIERKRGPAAETMSFDGAGNVNETTTVVESSRPPRVDRFHYDNYGHLLSNVVETVEVGAGSQPLLTSYEYDPFYRLRMTTLPGGEQQVSQFDHAGRVIASLLQTNGATVYKWEYAYDKNGNLKTNTFHHAVTAITYDGHDRPILSLSPAGAQNEFFYDAHGNLRTNIVTDSKAGGQLLSKVVVEYDDLDRAVVVTRETEAGPAVTSIAYDTAERRVITTSPLGAMVTNKIEKVGREWSQHGPLGRFDTALDPPGREWARTFTDGIGSRHTKTHFNDLGHPVSFTDAKQRVTTMVPEVDGRIMRVTLPGASSSFEATYTQDGLPKTVTKPEQQTLVVQYDPRRNATLEAPRFPGGPQGTTYKFDAAGRVSQVEDALQKGDGYQDYDEYGQPRVVQIARNAQVGLSYDPLGRLVGMEFSRNFSGGVDKPHYGFEYDALNRMTKTTNNVASLEIAYGKEGLPKSIGILQFDLSRALQQDFDREGGRTNLTYSDGLTQVRFERHTSGLLKSVLPNTGDPVIENAEYKAGALVTHRFMGPGGLIELIIDYDENRRETNRIYQVRGSPPLRIGVAYRRNDLGLITERHLVHAGTVDYFDYDTSLRLTNALIGVANQTPAPGTVPPGAYGRTFQYNELDVMTAAVLHNPHQLSVPTFGGTVGNNFDANLFVTSVTYPGATPVTAPRGVDEAGNTTSSRGFISPRIADASQLYPGDGFEPIHATYTYNELDQLVRVTRDDNVTIDNVYGPHGLRIRRTVRDADGALLSDFEYVYDGINLIEIHDFKRSRAVHALFYYGDNGDELLAGDIFDPTTHRLERYYYLTDSLGSPMAIVDAAGRVQEYYLYDAWGEATIRPDGAGLTPGAIGIHTRSAVGSPFLFQGQIYDEDAGLIYMRARFYDPALGVFLQRDPMGYEDSGNQNAGLGNNPVNFRDPTGRLFEGEAGQAGLAFLILRGSGYAIRAPILVSALPEIAIGAIVVTPTVALAALGIHDQNRAYNRTVALAEELAAKREARRAAATKSSRDPEDHHGWTIYGQHAEEYAKALELVCGFTGADAEEIVETIRSNNLRPLEGHRSSHAPAYHDFAKIYFQQALEEVLKETGNGKLFDDLTYEEKLERQEACFAFLNRARDELHEDMMLFREGGIDIENRKGWTKMWNEAEGRTGKDLFDRYGKLLEKEPSSLEELIRRLKHMKPK